MNISGFSSYLPSDYQRPAPARAVDSGAGPVPGASGSAAAILSSSDSSLETSPTELLTPLQRVNPGTASSELNTEESEREREERRVTEELAQRDREVRQHEMAHKAAAGSYAGMVRYEFERGPDGQLYAVGGEVSIDTSAVPDDPEATLEKAEIVLRAALAPVDPSPQDLRVAASARSMAMEARAEIQRREAEEREQEAEESEASRNQEQQEGDESRLGPAASYQELIERRAAVLDNLEQINTGRADNAERMRQRRQATAEELQAFAARLAEIREALRSLNNRLVETGVANKLYPPGALIDRQA
ncbi:putative metalloprotease CJM1_0395 family protein [Nitrincola alkalilacustris]|uniref:putative metalloprotease CJM1_0395 family protein n=1 Tax=Nitrincola alkalilacustris TaxID=1571224 RepID=UPI00124D95CA|nr:putative metalloprotease CJM1_0395 family protein [Nitrincola alkalilacustris]